MHKIHIFFFWVVLFISLQIKISSAADMDRLIRLTFPSIEFKEGYLKVSAENQKFQRIMGAIAMKADIKIVVYGNTDENCTINFDYLPIEKGLRQLLRGKNHILLYDSDEAHQPSRLTEVLVFPRQEGGKADRLTDQAQQIVYMNDVETDQILDDLDEVLISFPGNGVDVKKQIKRAMEQIEEMKIFKDIEK